MNNIKYSFHFIFAKETFIPVILLEAPCLAEMLIGIMWRY